MTRWGAYKDEVGTVLVPIGRGEETGPEKSSYPQDSTVKSLVQLGLESRCDPELERQEAWLPRAADSG